MKKVNSIACADPESFDRRGLTLTKLFDFDVVFWGGGGL